MKVALLLLHPRISGGGMSYTAYLRKALVSVGIEAEIVRPAKRTESRLREFGRGEMYQNVDLDELLADHSWRIIVTNGDQGPKSSYVAARRKDAIFVVHCHPNIDGKTGEFLEYDPPVVVIRKTLQSLMTDTVFIPHPYSPYFTEAPPIIPRKVACCRSRVAPHKNIELILDANRLGAKIDILGAANRLWAHYKLEQKYPEFEMTRGFGRGEGTAEELAAEYVFDVDLTVFKDDAGTQYTLFEAVDAGCVPVLHADWYNLMPILPKAFAVKTPESLVELIKRCHEIERSWNPAENREILFPHHSPERIGNLWRTYLEDTTPSV